MISWGHCPEVSCTVPVRSLLDSPAHRSLKNSQGTSRRRLVTEILRRLARGTWMRGCSPAVFPLPNVRLEAEEMVQVKPAAILSLP